MYAVVCLEHKDLSRVVEKGQRCFALREFMFVQNKDFGKIAHYYLKLKISKKGFNLSHTAATPFSASSSVFHSNMPSCLVGFF